MAHTEDSFSKFMKTTSKAIVSAALLSTLHITPTLADLPNPLTIGAIEQAVQRLETTRDRGESLQALADVYEISTAKPAYMRSKYKTRVVEAVNEKRVQLSSVWDQPLGYASSEVKKKIDPFRTVDLGPYLKIAPVIGGIGYLGALFVQQSIPELFIFAYPAAVFVLIAPVVFIVLAT